MLNDFAVQFVASTLATLSTALAYDDMKPLTVWPNGCLNHLLMPSCARVVHKPYFVHMIYLVYGCIAIAAQLNKSNGSRTQMNMHFFCRDQSFSHKHLYWCFCSQSPHVILFILWIVSTLVFLRVQCILYIDFRSFDIRIVLLFPSKLL